MVYKKQDTGRRFSRGAKENQFGERGLAIILAIVREGDLEQSHLCLCEEGRRSNPLKFVNKEGSSRSFKFLRRLWPLHIAGLRGSTKTIRKVPILEKVQNLFYEAHELTSIFAASRIKANAGEN